jgi:hypothetical protein
MFTKLKICYYILFRCRHERIGQFIVNRLKTHTDLFYLEDEALAYRLSTDPEQK